MNDLPVCVMFHNQTAVSSNVKIFDASMGKSKEDVCSKRSNHKESVQIKDIAICC